MRWQAQQLRDDDTVAAPGLIRLSSLVRSVSTPEFEGMTFHEVLAKSALNHVPLSSRMLPGAWTINPYRGCSHACLYCYARSTHRYLDLDTGQDFDSQIVVKVNVAEVLAHELATRTVLPERVALGTNTDPYQRAEGRYRLMPGIIAALTEHRVPFSILTKGTLLRRDLPLLAEANESTGVSLAMSIAIFDDELQQSLEPGTPSTAARLATVRQVRALGLDCSVFMAPVIPGLTDSSEQLDRALAEIKAAGATSVLYTPLRLAPDVKEWFLAWLTREHPALLPRYHQLYRHGSSAEESYRTTLEARMTVLRRRHALLDPPAGEEWAGSADRFSLRRFGPGDPLARVDPVSRQHVPDSRSAPTRAPEGPTAPSGTGDVRVAEQPALF